MIDYEKLQEAEEIIKKTPNIKIVFGYTENDVLKTVFDNIPNLIRTLQSLTKPDSKYKIGQKIWVQSLKFECENVLSMHAFEGTVIPCKECDYGLSEPYVRVIAKNDEFSGPESFCFPTRQALIENQLQYWRNQLEDDLEQHVSPYCEPKPCHHKYSKGKCIYCGDEDIFGGNFSKPDIQRNQSQVDVDRCQHESSGICLDSLPVNFDCLPEIRVGDKCRQHESDGDKYERPNSFITYFKCIKCGEFYR